MDYRDFGFRDAGASHMHRHFMPPLFAPGGRTEPGTRVLDVGCGNGCTAGQFLERGCEIAGIDFSQQGIALARATYPNGCFENLAADGDVLATEAGVVDLQFRGAGRFPGLWMTMLMSGTRPA